MRLNPRCIIPALPVLALAFLLVLWAALARWSGDMRETTDALRRRLQAVRMEKPALQAMRADRAARPAAADPQNRRGALYAMMEDTLRANGLSDAVRQLRPEVRELEERVEEQLTVSLTQLDRTQLARFLYETRKAAPAMTVDSLSIRRNNNGFLDLDAVFLLGRAK
jgi:hypothetical protein